MIDFSSITYEKLSQMLAEQWSQEMAESRKFYDGDHWQEGNGYTGPRPDQSADAQAAAIVMEEIRREFTSQNTIGEVVDRRVNGVLSRPVTFDIINPDNEEDAEDALVEEARKLLDDWIKEREAQETMAEAVTALTWGGRGPLRLFIPRSELIQNETELVVPAGTPIEQSLRVYFHAPKPEAAGIIVDQETQQRAGVYFYELDQRKYCELVYSVVDNGTGNQIGTAPAKPPLPMGAPARPAPNQRMTVVRIIPGPGTGDEAEQTHILPLGGDLLVYEMTMRALITPQIKSLQRSGNKNKTMWSRNQNLAGFLERTILNAELPGEWSYNEETQKDEFTPHPYKTGPGAMTALIGIEIEDKEGNKSLTRPDIIYRDPVSVETFVETDDRWHMRILQEAHQAHYAIAGDAVASAESRRTAMADYIVDLKRTAGKVEKAAVWMAKAILAISAYLAGEPGKFEVLEINAKANIYPGPLTADMIRVLGDLKEKGIYSTERTMSEVGVDDPLAEIKKIEQERQAMGMDIVAIEDLLGQVGQQQPGDQQPGDQRPNNQQPNNQQPGNRQPGGQTVPAAA